MWLQKFLVYPIFLSVVLTSPLRGACLPWDRLLTAASEVSPASLEQHLSRLFLSGSACHSLRMRVGEVSQCWRFCVSGLLFAVCLLEDGGQGVCVCFMLTG